MIYVAKMGFVCAQWSARLETLAVSDFCSKVRPCTTSIEAELPSDLQDDISHRTLEARLNFCMQLYGLWIHWRF